MKKILLIILCFCIGIAYGQQPIPIPAAAQSASILIVNATTHVGNGTVIENSAIGFNDGKITYVGKLSDLAEDNFKNYKKTIDAEGKHIYPGLIACNTDMGLVEIGAVRATQDASEVGGFNPSVRSIIAYSTDSRVTPTVRSNGVLMAQIAPRGWGIAGQSTVVELDAWNWEDAAYAMDGGIFMSWPRPYRFVGWWSEPSPELTNKQYASQLKMIKDNFKAAKSYADGANATKNLNFEAMKGLFDGSKTLYVRTGYATAMMEAVLFAEEHGINIVIVGGDDAWMITDFLKEHNVPVILGETQSLPSRQDADIDQPFKTPAALQNAGILYTMSVPGNWTVRNLPFHAGQAVPYGISQEEALQAITLNAAKILGIDKTVGSLEVGKDATLVVSNGDILDQLSHNVEHAFIRGKEIDLSNKQKSLAEKYRAKYGKE